MRYLMLCTTVLLIASLSRADFAPKTVSVPLDRGFIPVGFDDNDRVQFAVEGSFHNTCYKVGPYSVKVNKANREIRVQQQAYKYSGVCLQMFVPFSQIIDLGILESGDYTLVDAVSNKALGKMPINHATNPNQDDYLYAPMTDAYIQQEAPGKNNLIISGSFSDRCTDFKEIKVNYNDSVIVVQPVVTHNEAEAECPKEKTRFLKIVELRGDLKGVHLLHVRSMNGQAINKMVDIP